MSMIHKSNAHDNNNDVTRNTYRNNAIERGINRVVNNQQNMNEAIGRINNTRQSIQSYLHNVYSSNLLIMMTRDV